MQEVTELFTIGTSAKLYALAEDFTTTKSALEFLRLSPSNGAITELFTLKQPVNSTCFSTAISSATKIYSVCESFTSLNTTSTKVDYVLRPASCGIRFECHDCASSIAHVAHLGDRRHCELKLPAWLTQNNISKRYLKPAWLGKGLAMRIVILRSCSAADIPVHERQGTQGGRVPAQGPDCRNRHSPVEVRMVS